MVELMFVKTKCRCSVDYFFIILDKKTSQKYIVKDSNIRWSTTFFVIYKTAFSNSFILFYCFRQSKSHSKDIKFAFLYRNVSISTT